MRNKNGFTIIEMLMTIAIISTILAIVVFSVSSYIIKSKEQVNDLNTNLIQDAAEIYIKEYPNEINWKDDSENIDNEFTCISIQDIINKGILKQNIELSEINLENNTTIKILRDKYNYVITNIEINVNCDDEDV